MKRYIPFLLILACCAFVWGTTIQWTWKGEPIHVVNRLGCRLELGLRSDGVVVWREVTNTTNSPAEAQMVYTNLYLPYYTNNVIITY